MQDILVYTNTITLFHHNRSNTKPLGVEIELEYPTDVFRVLPKRNDTAHCSSYSPMQPRQPEIYDLCEVNVLATTLW